MALTRTVAAVRPLTRYLVAACMVSALVLSGAADSSAAPSREEDLRDQVAHLDGQIARVEADLLAADIALARAAETYDEARLRSTTARRAAAASDRAADAATAELATARADLALAAVAAYRSSPVADAIGVMVATGGDASLLDRMSTVQRLAATRDATVQRVQVTATMATVRSRQAADDADLATAAVAQVGVAADHARAQQTTTDERAAELAGRRDQLVARLVEIQETSLRAERARQDELAAQRTLAAGTTAPPAAPSAPSSAPSAPPPAPPSAPSSAPSAPPPAPPSAPPAVQAPSIAPPAPAPTTPDPAPDVAVPEPTSLPSGGLAAVTWARTQLGKPYLWGGAGPDSYDCSGLVMKAWGKAGLPLPHSSRSLYARSARLDRADLRPGDLIFWGTDPADPASIHHVAMYSGDGMMIEAPNSRNVVREVPIRWAGAMPTAGRL